MENTNGERLTYIQRYYASDIRSEQEQWVLFENSLGGIDTFRAYGNSENTAKHTHNIAEIENDSEEYRVDTTREYKKNTGHLSAPERKWLLDFFPSLGKYLYAGTHIRRIVVTESEVSWQTRELPSSYTFTYKYADSRPYLNLSRTDIPAEVLDIKIPDIGSFTVAPRLVELDRLPLSGGALFPVQSPYSDKWSTTTAAAVLDWLSREITSAYKGDGSFGHSHSNISLLESMTKFGNYLLIGAKKISAGLADVATKALGLDPKSSDWDKILRKDTPDTAREVIRFLKGIALGEENGRYYLDGDGFGRLYRLVVSSVTSSRYTAGDEGRGYSIYEDEHGAGTLEVDNLKVRKKMTVAELEVRKKTYTSGNLSLGKAGNTIFAVRPFGKDDTPMGDMVFAVGGVAIAVRDGGVEVLGKRSEYETPSYYRCYFISTDGDRTIDNCWRIADQAKCQTSNLVEGTTANAANRYYWRLVVGKGTETLEDGRQYHYVDLSNEKTPVVEIPPRVAGSASRLYKSVDGEATLSWEEYTATYPVEPQAGDVYLFAHTDGAGSQPEVIIYTTAAEHTILVPKQDDIYRTAAGKYYRADLDYNSDLWVEVSPGLRTCTGYDLSVANDTPHTGDDIVQEGSQTDKDRQGLMVLDSDDGISKYKGIDSFTLEGKRKQHIGDTVELEVNRLTIVSSAPDGTPESYPVPCDMGAWTARPYPYYARVSKDGSLWLCANPDGAKPTDIPSDGSAVWQKQVGKGEKGDKGDAVSSYTYIRYSDDGGQTFTAADDGKLSEARKIQGIGRNYANQPPAYKNEKVITLYDGFIENQPAEIPFVLSARAKYHISAAAKSGEMKSNISPKLENGTTVWSSLLFANGKSTLKADGTEKDGEASFSKKINGRIASMPGIWLRAFVYLEDGITKDPDSYWYDIQIEYGPLTDYMPAPEDMVAGTTPGKWLGVAVWDKPYPPLEPSAYMWSKVQGPDGLPGKAAEFFRLRAVTEKAVVDGSGKLTASLSYQVEHVTGADIEMRDTSPDGVKIRYRGDTGTPADTVMGYGSISTATYVLEDYSHVPHPDNLVVELLGADGSVLDRRTVPVTFSTMAALDINGQLGEITARVQGMAGGGRNLLKGTAFRKDHPDWFQLSSGATIDPAIRHDGHNSVDCTASGQAANVYKGVFFKTNVEPGKEYTASVWAYGEPATIDLDAHLEIIHTDAQGQRQHVALQSIKPTQANTWQRTSCTFTVPAGTESIECNIFVVRNGNLHIAEPMLTSGNMLSDWQPAPEDAEAYLSEIKASIANISLSITDLKTGLESVGIHLFSAEKPQIRLVGNNVGFYGTDGKMYIGQGVDDQGRVYLIIYDKDGITPKYNLGYMGMPELIGNAVPYSMVVSESLGPIPPGTVLSAQDLWNDLQTTPYASLRHTVWVYTEAYTLDGQGNRLYQYGGVYNGMYDSPAVDSDNKPTGNKLPENPQGAYIGVWDTSDPNHNLKSTTILYNYPNAEGRSAERLKVNYHKDYYGPGLDRYMLSLRGGDYEENMTVPLALVNP